MARRGGAVGLESAADWMRGRQAWWFSRTARRGSARATRVRARTRADAQQRGLTHPRNGYSRNQIIRLRDPSQGIPRLGGAGSQRRLRVCDGVDGGGK